MSARPRLRLLLLVTCHQSLVASPEQVDHAVANVYGPLLDALEAAPSQRLALYFNGYLLDRLARAHEGFLLRLKAFVGSGQVELLGGLFYGGPPSLLPENDVRGQVAMLGEFWASFVGSSPRGMYLPELAWAPELPRLMEDTGIDYAFASTKQLQPAPFLSRIERGGLPLVTFALDADVSKAYRPGEEAAWAAAAVAAAKAPPADAHGAPQPVGLHLACEALATGGGSVRERAAALFAGISEQGGETHLPRHYLATPPPVQGAALIRPYAPWWRPAHEQVPPVQDWAGFPGSFAEAQVIYRRMLRASDRLGRAIARMEDQGLDNSWSDALATAQRLIFAAQSTEALGCGSSSGVFDPEVRQAVLGRIIDAERLLDTLAHGEAAFVELEEGDFDHDLQADYMVQTPQVTAWLKPSRGGAVRALDHRGWRINVLDAGTRRPWAGENAASLDVAQRRGLRCAWFAADATMDACVTGQAVDLLVAASPTGLPSADPAASWQAEVPTPRDGSEAEAAPLVPCSLTQRARPDLGSLGKWYLCHTVTVPAEAFGLTWRSHWQHQGPAEAVTPTRWALELPLSLGSGALHLEVNGEPLPPGAHTLPAGAEVVISGEMGAVVVRAHNTAGPDTTPFTLWFVPLTGLLADASQERTVHLGAAVWLSRTVGAHLDVAVTLAARDHGPAAT